jgi:hypothetical protein
MGKVSDHPMVVLFWKLDPPKCKATVSPRSRGRGVGRSLQVCLGHGLRLIKEHNMHVVV